MFNQMVERSAQNLDKIFGALADPTRRAILNMVSDSPYSVTELAEPFDMSLAAVSKHIAVLENAGLLTRRKSGRRYSFKPNPQTLREASKWLAFYEEFWSENLDSLAHYIDATNNEEENS